ncbi:hypothetical protein QQF64_021602 [Cirrhinus molitorella]|uniref:Uncharacterized protein n=1 Tax=Cirrhinus molitorella TaxID=172907 RepID=A0ABR3L5S9_9TELE
MQSRVSMAPRGRSFHGAMGKQSGQSEGQTEEAQQKALRAADSSFKPRARMCEALSTYTPSITRSGGSLPLSAFSTALFLQHEINF